MIRLFTIPSDSVAFGNIADDAITHLADEGILHPTEVIEVIDAEPVEDGMWRVSVEVA